jgi:hypothetical protein
MSSVFRVERERWRNRRYVLSQWHKEPGDLIADGDVVCTIATDEGHSEIRLENGERGRMWTHMVAVDHDIPPSGELFEWSDVANSGRTSLDHIVQTYSSGAIAPRIDAEVMLSYRRADAEAYAGRLHERLVADFGEPSVFMDQFSIAPGANWLWCVQQAAATCRVMLVTIGPSWTRIADDAGLPRLHQASDTLRLEVLAGLDRGIRIVPVLVGGASLPTEASLPWEMRPILRLQALELTTLSWKAGVEQLVTVIRQSLQEGSSSPTLVRSASPVVSVDFGTGTARWNGKQLPSVDVRIHNSGGPFILVARAKLVAVSDGLDWEATDEWWYQPRTVLGGHGSSWFHIATLETVVIETGRTWLVEPRGEGMLGLRRWQGPGSLWFDVEWRLYSRIDGTLHEIGRTVARVLLSEDGTRLMIQEVPPGTAPPVQRSEPLSHPTRSDIVPSVRTITTPTGERHCALQAFSPDFDVLGDECEWLDCSVSCRGVFGPIEQPGNAAFVRITNRGYDANVVARLFYDGALLSPNGHWYKHLCNSIRIDAGQSARLMVALNTQFSGRTPCLTFNDERDCRRSYTIHESAMAVEPKPVSPATCELLIELVARTYTKTLLFDVTMSDGRFVRCVRRFHG